jgi:hypothetical protein
MIETAIVFKNVRGNCDRSFKNGVLGLRSPFKMGLRTAIISLNGVENCDHSLKRLMETAIDLLMYGMWV